MTFDEYQKKTGETAIYPRGEMRIDLAYCSLGLCGEAGELANKIKKIYRDRGGVISQQELRSLLTKEIGDCLWYISELCSLIGLDLQEAAQLNTENLADRKVRGVLGGSGDNR